MALIQLIERIVRAYTGQPYDTEGYVILIFAIIIAIIFILSAPIRSVLFAVLLFSIAMMFYGFGNLVKVALMIMLNIGILLLHQRLTIQYNGDNTAMLWTEGVILTLFVCIFLLV